MFNALYIILHLLTFDLIFDLNNDLWFGQQAKIKEHLSLSNLGTVALHAAKVPTNVFSSTLICILTLDYYQIVYKT